MDKQDLGSIPLPSLDVSSIPEPPSPPGTERQSKGIDKNEEGKKSRPIKLIRKKLEQLRAVTAASNPIKKEVVIDAKEERLRKEKQMKEEKSKVVDELYKEFVIKKMVEIEKTKSVSLKNPDHQLKAELLPWSDAKTTNEASDENFAVLPLARKIADNMKSTSNFISLGKRRIEDESPTVFPIAPKVVIQDDQDDEHSPEHIALPDTKQTRTFNSGEFTAKFPEDSAVKVFRRRVVISSEEKQDTDKKPTLGISLKISDTSAALIKSGEPVPDPLKKALEDGEISPDTDEDSDSTTDSEDDDEDAKDDNDDEGIVESDTESVKNASKDKEKKKSKKDKKKKKKKDKKKHKEKKKKKKHKENKDRSKLKSSRQSRSRSRSKSFDKSTGIWTDHSRSRSRDRKKGHSADRKHSRRRSRSRSIDRHRDRYSRERSSYSERHSDRYDRERESHYRDRDRERRHLRSKSPELKIDKAKLREIAIANALRAMQSGGTNVSQKQLARLKAGGLRSVNELTDLCKDISEKDLKRQQEYHDSSSDNESIVNRPAGPEDEPDSAFIHHPFLVSRAKADIVMNIRNAKQLPILTASDKASQSSTLRLTYPVSSGSQHRSKESEWVPVEKTVVDPNTGVSRSTIAFAKQEEKVFEETPEAPIDIGTVVSERLQAVRRLQDNPNDVQAMSSMYKIQKKMSQWAESKNQPGKFIGSTGAQILSQRELEGDKKRQAWFKKEQFVKAAPVSGGIGKLLLQRMGWTEGQGLGKNNEGNNEPLMLDFKIDRKGLVGMDEVAPATGGKKKGGQRVLAGPPLPRPKDLSGKHPVSALMELTTKRKWGAPEFTVCFEEGPDHKKNFLFKVKVNGVDYQPTIASNNKKHAKAQAATVCLQAFGLIPR